MYEKIFVVYERKIGERITVGHRTCLGYILDICHEFEECRMTDTPLRKETDFIVVITDEVAGCYSFGDKMEFAAYRVIVCLRDYTEKIKNAHTVYY